MGIRTQLASQSCLGICSKCLDLCDALPKILGFKLNFKLHMFCVCLKVAIKC